VKLRLAALCVAVLALPASVGAASGFTATLLATTHTPRVNAKWFYTVRASRAGKPARATVTSQLVDPLGTVHAVEFGCCHRNVTNHPFTGVFRDYVKFPPESQGFKVTLRVTVKAPGAKRVLTYWIKAR
jgi:hypothetical protein